MSNYLTGLAQLNPQVKRHNGGTATLTLDENGQLMPHYYSLMAWHKHRA